MKGLLKFVTIGFSILIVLVICALVVLRTVFPPEKLKALALTKLQAALHRQVRIESIGIGLRGLTIGGLEVSEAPDFGKGKFLSVGDLQASLRLTPLLHRRLEIRKIVLKNWECSIIKQANGALNVATLAGPEPSNVKSPLEKPKPARAAKNTKGEPAAALSPKEGSSEAPEWSIDYILSRNGKITYKDVAGGTIIALNAIDMNTSSVSAQDEFPLDLSFEYHGSMGKTPIDGNISFSGTLNLGQFDAAKMSVHFDPLKLEYEGVKLGASGAVQDLENPAIELQLQAASLGKIKELAEATQGASLPPLTGNVRIKKTGDTLLLNQIHLTLGSLVLDSRGKLLQPRNRPSTISAEIKTNNFSVADIAGLYPPASGYHLQGNASLQLRADGALSAPALNGEVLLQSVAADYSGVKLTGVSGNARLSPAAVSAQLTGKWNQGDFRVNMTASNYRTVPDIRLEGNLSRLDLAALSAPASSPKNESKSPAPASPGTGAGETPSSRAPSSNAAPTRVKTSGKITIGPITHPNFTASNAELDWNLAHAAELDRISGTAKFKINDGKFDNLKLLGDGNPYVRIALMPIIMIQKVASLVKIPLFPAFDRVNYKDITGDYVFQNGVMTVKESHLDSNAAYVTASGTVDLGKDQLKLHVATKIASQIGANLSGPLGFNIVGSLEDPKVKIDAAAILKQPAVEKILNQTGVKQAVQQGQQLLQNLFK